MLYYNLFKSNWVLNKGTGTNQIACWNDLTHASKTGTQCPPLSEIKANVSSGYTVTVRGNYSNTQLVKYSDITYTAKSTGITYDVDFTVYAGAIGYDINPITIEFPQIVKPNYPNLCMGFRYNSIAKINDSSNVYGPNYTVGTISDTWTLKSGVNPSDDLQVNYTVTFSTVSTSFINKRIYLHNPMSNFSTVETITEYTGYDGKGNALRNDPSLDRSNDIISVLSTADSPDIDGADIIGKFNTILSGTVEDLTISAGIGIFPSSSPTEWTD